MQKSVLFFMITSMISIQCAFDYKPLVGTLQEYYFAKHPRSYVTYVSDQMGNNYVVKQYRYEKWPSILATSICELVALDIGHVLDISLNQACLIPAGVPFIGKETPVPASLHTLVPGIPFEEYATRNTGLYVGLDLKQKKDNSEEPAGLTRDLIYHMSRHKDFAYMVALDTFVCNMGRLQHNIFYDEETDRFYGIDMASSFYKDLCSPSVKNVTHMLIRKRTYFTLEEGKALKRYYRALKKMVAAFPPDFICNQIDSYARLAGYYDPLFFDKDVQAACLDLLAKRKMTIQKSYTHAKDLINVLKKLLKQHAVF